MDNEVEQGKQAFEDIEQVIHIAEVGQPLIEIISQFGSREDKADAFDALFELHTTLLNGSVALLGAIKKVMEDAAAK